MTYYMYFIQTLVKRCTINEIQPLERSVTERSYMTLYMYFIQTLVTACIVSEILAQIDNKGLNWTFLTLKITFIINQHH